MEKSTEKSEIIKNLNTCFLKFVGIIGWFMIFGGLLFPVKLSAQCNFSVLAFDGFEYSTQIPGIVVGTTYHPNPSSYAARTGLKGVYMNFVNNLPGNTLVMSRSYAVCPGYQYKMSAWFKEINGGSSTVTTRIKDSNGTVLTTSTTTYYAGGGWGQWISPSVTPTTGTMYFELIFVSGVGNNDFGMDDLSIEICTSTNTPDSIDICSNASPINLFDSVTTVSSTTGVWSGPSTLTNGYLGTFDPSTMLGGVYDYTVANSIAACPDSVATITLDLGQAPIVDLGPDTSFCVGDSFLLDAFNSNASYVWQDGSTGSDFMVKVPGTYWVEVMSGCSIVTKDTVVIGFNSYPIVNLGNDSILCDGDTLVLDATIPNATYQWYDGSPTAMLNAISSGTKWVDVTVDRCTTRDSIDLTFNTVPVVNLGADTAICDGDTLILNAGNIGATYVWQDNSTNSTLGAFSNGQYWVEVTNINCKASDTMNITITPIPVINLGPDQIVCDGELFYLDAYYSSSATYIWNDGSTNHNLAITQSDTYWVDVEVSQCHGYDTVIYTFNPLPIIDLGADTLVCYPDTIMLDASYPAATYVWHDNTTLSSHLAYSQGMYAVTLTNNNCTFKDSVYVTIEPKPMASLGNDTILCPNTSILKGNIVSGAGYLWQDGSVKAHYEIVNPGMYWVQVTKGNCVNSDTVVVDSAVYPTVYLGEDTLLCVGDIFSMSSTFPESNYLWSTGSSDSVLTVGTAGEYWVDVTNICGTVSDTLDLSYTTLPEINLGEDTIVCLGDVVTLDAYWFNATKYLWLDGSDFSSFDVYEEGQYLVNVTNMCGSVEDTIDIEYRHCDCDLFIPNAFTPNGDGLDEFFGPESYCVLKAYNFIIFDRWGKEVFNTLDPDQKWDGKLNGKNLPVGIYTYVLKYNFRKRGPKTDYEVKYGMVKLIR